MKTQRSNWLGRSLSNYKSMHEGTASRKGVGREFQNARTLTQARKILWGVKAKNARLSK